MFYQFGPNTLADIDEQFEADKMTAGAGAAYITDDKSRVAKIQGTEVVDIVDLPGATQDTENSEGANSQQHQVHATWQTGGHAVEIDIEGKNNTYLYEIKTISGEKVAAVFVDMATGKIVSTEARNFNDEERIELAKLDSSQTTLAAAIGAAEQQVDGKAVEAEYENENGQTLFKVEIAKDKTVHKVEIDAATGKVIKVERD